MVARHPGTGEISWAYRCPSPNPKFARVRAILQWGVQNKLVSSNAAEDVSLDVKAKQGERKRSFTDEEAKTILRAALSEKDPVKRWVPWIGAYTGARLSEICQLRR